MRGCTEGKWESPERFVTSKASAQINQKVELDANKLDPELMPRLYHTSAGSTEWALYPDTTGAYST